ncbi:polysaccharide biosynthesis/export family protein [Piscinibacter sp.]|jgi:polysaccharide export outer membrane protein|uniref:polysaccharide biosynthesis/export family protein n=1 Tax=Piscinibacter sp. TaxID=1903157 RepID=UPI0035595E0E
MRTLHFLAAMCLLTSATLVLAADETPAGGTFNAPGYTPVAPQRPGATAPGAAAPGGTAPTTARPAQPTDAATGVDLQPGQRPEARPRRAELPAPKPSEFQKFVEAATGRLLPVFGATFFAASTAEPQGPIDNVPVSADYVVGPGDQLVIRAWGSIDVDYRATVDRNGQISLPKVGSFNVAGVKASELEGHLRSQIGRMFTNFSLNVTLGHLRGVKVFVVGPAQRPGVYTLPSQSTMLSAVAAAGGPGPNGSMRKISLRRDGQMVSELDVYDFLVQGDKSKDIQLVGGDVVVFQPVGPRVAVTGAIDTPAIYELLREQEPMRDVLRYAGGAPVLANPHRGQLERIDTTQPRAARFVEEFKLDASGLQTPLRDGDVLTLLAISPQFANAVTLKGHVAQPLRYAYQPGMRISDLIPDKDALIAPDFYRRKNLLVQVIEDDEEDSGNAADRTGLPERADGAPTRKRRTTAEQDEVRAAAARAKKTPAALFDELNWDYAVIERLNEKDLSTQVIPFNLGRAVLQHDPVQNVELLPGDVVTVYSQKDVRVPTARQTRLVTLDGEVAAPGIYQLLPGETLKGLIARSGGLTPQAYVYGVDFSREETRQRQRENLTAAMARLQALSATQSAREAANRRDDTSAAASTAVSQAATQAQLARLAQLQPNGRIALELTPEARTLDALPDVPLEHGDRISVPTRPGFVTVAGAVANNNAFLWKPGRTAGDYVKLAGLDQAADAANMFILRADGTVASANEQRGFFGYGGIESQALQPGDAVVVPNQLDYETWGRALVRNLKDWSQIFYQFGLGAAAIQTLRK